ncbi:hypothetical protein VPH35_089641 [Triticum aestivum]
MFCGGGWRSGVWHRWCVSGGSDAWSSPGDAGGQQSDVVVPLAVGGGAGRSGVGGGFPVSWRLHGGLAALTAAVVGFSDVASSAFGPFRPSPHLLVVRALRPSKGWPSPSRGPSLISRPVRQDRARLAHGAAGPSSSRAQCSRTDLVPLTMLQDRARLALGAAGRADGCQFWRAYWVSTPGSPRGVKGGSFPLVSLLG